MNKSAFLKNLGVFSLASSPMFLPSLLCALWYKEAAVVATFFYCMLFTFACGGLLYMLGRRAKTGLQHRETLGLVGAGWLLIALYGAIPYILSGHLSFVDAYFESMSGFSTTGASILSDIEVLPKGILFWRSLRTGWADWASYCCLSLYFPFWAPVANSYTVPRCLDWTKAASGRASRTPPFSFFAFTPDLPF